MERWLIIIWLFGGLWHMLERCGFNQEVFAIWWLFLLCVLGILWDNFFEKLFLSLWCELYGERWLLGFFRIFARRVRWYETWFISSLALDIYTLGLGLHGESLVKLLKMFFFLIFFFYKSLCKDFLFNQVCI